jgi:hypothetical protein
MSQDTNAFGGGNRHFLYVPMSEHEQEALARMVETGALCVHVVDWGVVHKPRVQFGDARLTLTFRLDFDRPEVPMDVYYFDLELRTESGLLLFADRKSTEYGGKPLAVASGLFLEMEWAIQIRAMDPKVVKAFLPGATGLTSRLQDRDTKDMTLDGNMALTGDQRKKIIMVREGEEAVKQDDRQQADKATKRQKARYR